MSVARAPLGLAWAAKCATRALSRTRLARHEESGRRPVAKAHPPEVPVKRARATSSVTDEATDAPNRAGETPMSYVRLLLVRHGRTAWNHERRFLGATDLPLDEVGTAEAAALGARLGGTFTAVYSSPLSRALQTASAIAPPTPVIVDALRELCQGELEGLDGPTALERHPEFFVQFQADPTHCRPPGNNGETLAETRDRALTALVEIASRHAAGTTVAVVTHQMVIASVRCALRGEPLSAWRTYGVPNTGTAALYWDGRSLVHDLPER